MTDISNRSDDTRAIRWRSVVGRAGDFQVDAHKGTLWRIDESARAGYLTEGELWVNRELLVSESVDWRPGTGPVAQKCRYRASREIARMLGRFVQCWSPQWVSNGAH